MKSSLIKCYIDPNERPKDDKSHRINAFKKVIEKDPLFELQDKYRDQIVDLIFEGGNRKKKVNVELKMPSDYITSVLGPQGHLWEQVTSMQESGNPSMILVLGSDSDIAQMIYARVDKKHHFKKSKELFHDLVSDQKRVFSFEIRCKCQRIPVEHWAILPWNRLLWTVEKMVVGKYSLMDFSPKPAGNNRSVAALKMAQGVGKSTAETLVYAWGNIAQICQLKVEDIAMTYDKNGRRLGEAKAQAVYELLHGGNNEN